MSVSYALISIVSYFTYFTSLSPFDSDFKRNLNSIKTVLRVTLAIKSLGFKLSAISFHLAQYYLQFENGGAKQSAEIRYKPL